MPGRSVAHASHERPTRPPTRTGPKPDFDHNREQALSRLGRTLKQRAADMLAYFDRPGTSNGPTEAINGRLEHLRGTALGFRNLTNYITRSLLDTGDFRSRLHPLLR
ncbi:transposase [Streptomyces sp. NPDC097727]|uniref:transposase n=1 Tax=Streptomyces sp. NPDC097727 TaxID=3366092 RepID=UPI00381961BD